MLKPLPHVVAPLTLFPPDLSGLAAFALIALSLFASMITAALGLGGGMLMMAGLAVVFPPALAVPVHGCIQLGSNAGRALVQRLHVQWSLVLWLGFGAVLGSLLGGAFALAIPQALFQALIGLFILLNVWAPRPRVAARGPVANFLGGVVIAALGMVIGPTGPLVADFLKHLPDRRQIIGTHAFLMTWVNSAKVAAFALFGFAFGAYLPLIIAMVVSGFVGTLIGSRFLTAMPEAVFRTAFKITLSVIALYILANAVITAV